MSRQHQVCDVLVVGAGPAGMAAAYRAAEGGMSVTVVDDNPAAGGQIWRGEATKTLKQQKNPEKLQKNLNKAMVKLLKNYPPPVK